MKFLLIIFLSAVALLPDVNAKEKVSSEISDNEALDIGGYQPLKLFISRVKNEKLVD